MTEDKAKAWFFVLRLRIEGRVVKTELTPFTNGGLEVYSHRTFPTVKGAEKWYAKAKENRDYCLKQLYKALKFTK